MDETANPAEWLNETLKNEEENEDPSKLNLPKRKTENGFVDYEVDMLYPDQAKVVATVVGKIKEWMECDDYSKFQPLRMTVRGAGGSGKSVVINTIVSVLRRMFEYNGVVQVAAPTGTAAFNVGGETFYHLTGSKVTKAEYTPNSMKNQKEKRAKLIKKFKYMLALLVDERSLINSADFGTTSQKIAENIYNGGPFKDEDFGGLPVVVIFGDDYQLPSTNEGALQCLDPPKKAVGKMTLIGRSVLRKCGTHVMTLNGSKRMQDSQVKEKELVEAVRLQKDLTEEQSTRLMNLTVKEYEKRNGTEARKALERNSIHLFYTNEKKTRHNIRQLYEVSNKTNPAAFIPQHSSSNTTGRADARHFDKDSSGICMLCKGAAVAIEGRNFNPLWGLHNGACGRVQEIVYAKGESPNTGDLPSYVIVDFPLYCGPAWDKDNPTHVPIPPLKQPCNYSSSTRECCSREYIPLTLAWGRTIHKFQGMSAGPVDKGKIPNMFSSIICDPDKRESERNALGLFYTALSRATTLGDPNGDNSAIYFTGEDFNQARIRNIGRLKQTEEDYVRVKQRRTWVQYLNAHNKCTVSDDECNSIFMWISTSKYDTNDLHNRIRKYTSQRSAPDTMEQDPFPSKKRRKR